MKTAPQDTGTRLTTRLGLYRSSDVTFIGQGPELAKLKKVAFWAEITKFNACQSFPQYVTQITLVVQEQYADLAQPRNHSVVFRPFSSWEGGIYTWD